MLVKVVFLFYVTLKNFFLFQKCNNKKIIKPVKEIYILRKNLWPLKINNLITPNHLNWNLNWIFILLIFQIALDLNNG